MYSKIKTTSIMRKVLLFIVPLLFCVFSINAQSINAEENAAIGLVSASKAKLALTAEDLGNVMVSKTYQDNATGIRMVSPRHHHITKVFSSQTQLGFACANQTDCCILFCIDRLCIDTEHTK